MEQLILHIQSSSHWNSEIEKSKSGRQPRLIMAILKCIWRRILLHAVMMLTDVSDNNNFV